MRNTPEHLTVGVEFFRRNIPGLIAKVEGGRAVVTLTSHGRSVARLVPLDDAYGKRTAFLIDSDSLDKDPDAGLPDDPDLEAFDDIAAVYGKGRKARRRQPATASESEAGA